MLSREEWLDVKPPFFYIKVQNNDWTPSVRQMILHWIGEHCGGWCYNDGESIYIFELIGDRLLFKLWLSGRPFDGYEGEVR